MTNEQKFLKEGKRNEFIKLINEELDNAGGQFNIEEFLNKQVKPTLTEDERVILRNIDKKYRTILRQHKNIWIAENNDGIRIYHGYCFDYYNSNLFQFIKER